MTIEIKELEDKLNNIWEFSSLHLNRDAILEFEIDSSNSDGIISVNAKFK
jgi:hypothetical protein